MIRGFSVVVVGKGNTDLVKRRMCRHCGGGFRSGERAFVDERFESCIHVKCVRAMNEMVGAEFADSEEQTSAWMLNERQRIMQEGKFYG